MGVAEYAGIPAGEDMLPPDVVWPCGCAEGVGFDLNDERRFWADDFRRIVGLGTSEGATDIDIDRVDWLKLDILQ